MYLHIFLPIFGEALLIQTVTPLEPLLQEVQHTVFAVPGMPRILAKFALWAESVQVSFLLFRVQVSKVPLPLSPHPLPPQVHFVQASRRFSKLY